MNNPRSLLTDQFILMTYGLEISMLKSMYIYQHFQINP